MNLSPDGRASCSSLAFRGAVRLAAAALTGRQGGRCVWTHDFVPANNAPLGDVVRCIVIGVPNEATPHTLKDALRAPISFVDPSAPAAGLRGMGRVELNERHTGSLSLVGQEAVAEHVGDLPGQTPRVERLRRMIVEHDGLRQYCCASPRSRRTVVTGCGVRAERGVGVRDLADHADRGLGRQPKALPHQRRSAARHTCGALRRHAPAPTATTPRCCKHAA